jgi:hypothetical protein
VFVVVLYWFAEDKTSIFMPQNFHVRINFHKNYTFTLI